MSAITDEIAAIESYLSECFASYALIDPKKVERLVHLKTERVRELVSTHHQRLEFMQNKTRELTEKLSSVNLSHCPDVSDKIHAELDKYDSAAVHWVNSESTLWGESEAFSIYAGIVISINEIH